MKKLKSILAALLTLAVGASFALSACAGPAQTGRDEDAWLEVPEDGETVAPEINDGTGTGSGTVAASGEISYYDGGEYLKDGVTQFYNKNLWYSNTNDQGYPDPFVLDNTAKDGYYYAYGTISGFVCLRSKDLAHWEKLGASLIADGSKMLKSYNGVQAKTTGVRNQNTETWDISEADLIAKNLWAPEVVYDPDDDKYYMFFSATPSEDNIVKNSSAKGVLKQGDGRAYFLYVAEADHPAGPFTIINHKERDDNPNTPGALSNKPLNTQTNVRLSTGTAPTNEAYMKIGNEYYRPAYHGYYANYPVLRQDYLTQKMQELGYENSKKINGQLYVGTIDPHPYVDPITHKKYLYVKLEGREFDGNIIFVMEMINWTTPDWSTFTYCIGDNYYTIEDYLNPSKRPTDGIDELPYEMTGCNEGPFMIYRETPDGKNDYFLTYSVNGYTDRVYAVATAVADSPMGPFRKLEMSEGGLLLSAELTASTTVSGTGHHCFIKGSDGKDYIIYHRHTDASAPSAVRYTCMDEVKWISVPCTKGGTITVPYVNGPTDSVQPLPEFASDYKNVAEDATITALNNPQLSKKDLSWMNDGYLSVFKPEQCTYGEVNAFLQFAENFKETMIKKTTTFKVTLDKTEDVRAVMIYNSAEELNAWLKVSKIVFTLADGSKRTVKDLVVDRTQDVDVQIDEETGEYFVYYIKSGTGVYCEFAEMSVDSIEITVDKPGFQQEVGISEIRVLANKNGSAGNKIPGTDTYSFENPTLNYTTPDTGVVIDGKLEEEEWKKAQWMELIDYGAANSPSATDYAKIRSTMFYGEKGVYLAYDIQYFGNLKAYVNLKRSAYINSGIEMYMSTSSATSYLGRKPTEIDWMADGSYNARAQWSGGSYIDVSTSAENMPVVAATNNGSTANIIYTDESDVTKYTIEIFMPIGFLNHLQYNIQSEDNLNGTPLEDVVFYINPVHIWSFNVSGTNSGRDRYWSNYANYYFSGTGNHNPSTFLPFSKVGYGYAAELDENSDPAVIKVASPLSKKGGTILIVASGPVTSIKINGEEKLSTCVRQGNSNNYIYQVPAGSLNGNVKVSVS